MTAIAWMLLGMLVWIGAMWAVLLLVRANRLDEEERPYGREHELDRIRDGGAL